MAEYRKKFVAVDLETTHLDVREGRIMEVGACEFELIWDDKEQTIIVNFGSTFSSLVNPEIKPSDTALAITGIKKEELEQAPLWTEVKPQLEEFVGKTGLIGHNIGFDLGYLDNQGLKLQNEIQDTLEWGRTLVPLETSHSLESLAEGFAVLKDVPHRALVDCQNTARVAAGILNKFLRYPKRLQAEVKKILQKSKINFIHIIEDLPSPKAEGLIEKTAKPQRSRSQSEPQTSNFQFPDFVDKTVYCYPIAFRDWPNLLEHLTNRPEQAIIGLSHKAFLIEGLKQNITNPNLALCEIRFSQLLSCDVLSSEMAKILSKITIFKHLKNSFDLSEIKWAPDELPVLHYLTVNPEVCPRHHCTFVKALTPKNPQLRFADLETVFEMAQAWHELTPRPPRKRERYGQATLSLQKRGSLMLFDLSAIEDKFTESVIQTWNLKKLRSLFAPLFPVDPGQPSLLPGPDPALEAVLNELDLFFGILHLVYLKRDGEFSENLIVDENEREHDRFVKLFHPAEKLTSKLAAFTDHLAREKKLQPRELEFEIHALCVELNEAKTFLEKFFLKPEPDELAWLKFNSAWVDLNLQPRSLDAEWKKFTEKFAATTLVDSTLPQASRNYFSNRLGLDEYQFEKCLDSATPEIPVKIFSKNLAPQEQINMFANLSARTMLLVPNEHTLAKNFQDLRTTPAMDAEILAYKFSGNVGVLKKKLRNFQDHKLLWLLTVHAFTKHWPILPAVNNLVVFKLPFEARDSKPALLDLPESRAFLDHVLPRAIASLHRIVTTFLRAPGENKKIFILDPRILTDYDQSFLRYLEEFPDFRISTD